MNFDHKLAAAIVVVVIAIAGLVLMLSYSPLEATDADRAVYTCMFLCKSALNEGRSLDNGPCLSSGWDAWEVDNWVCDVAHWPREDVDNLEQNQCPEYGVTASHFIEVSPECGFIRAV